MSQIDPTERLAEDRLGLHPPARGSALAPLYPNTLRGKAPLDAPKSGYRDAAAASVRV